MNNKKSIFGIGGVIALIIISIILFNNKSKSEEKFLKENNLDQLTVKEMVSYLDEVTDERTGFYANITPSTFTVGDENNEYKYKVPKDEFYLSFAPYINQTHDCFNHNLVTCRGELKNQSFQVLIKDDSGNVIVNDNYTSMNNGFIGIWLPKNMEGTITVLYNGLSVTSEISTDSNNGTCVTTLQLT